MRASGPQSKKRGIRPRQLITSDSPPPLPLVASIKKKIHLARIIFPPKIHHTMDKNICKGFAFHALKNKIIALEALIFFFNARNAADEARRP